jgi:hypothetical protein
LYWIANFYFHILYFKTDATILHSTPEGDKSMETRLNTETKLPPSYKTVYIPVIYKFFIAQSIAFTWMIFSIRISIPWLKDLSSVVGLPLAVFI